MANNASFRYMYPAIAWWVANSGLIELGYDDYQPSFVRALDPGGMVWEGDAQYASVDAALAALDAALAAFIRDQLKIDVARSDEDAPHTER